MPRSTELHRPAVPSVSDPLRSPFPMCWILRYAMFRTRAMYRAGLPYRAVSDPPRLPLSSQVLDEEADVFVVKMWRLLIYEIQAKKNGLVK